MASINEIMMQAINATNNLQQQFQKAEVRDQIEFMLGIYRSIALLYWTISEMRKLH